MNTKGKKTILIVDDEPTTGLILQHFLEDNYSVVLKEDGAEAVSWLEKGNEPDLIISDLQMPGMDGKDFVKAIRASFLFREIPLIVLSGAEDSSVRISCIEMGADDFIVKPFNPAEVKARISGILRRVEKAA
jgi:DNA-binding response OmpR family regulator